MKQHRDIYKHNEHTPGICMSRMHTMRYVVNSATQQWAVLPWSRLPRRNGEELVFNPAV